MSDREALDHLRRISTGASAPEPAYERLLTRRDRRRRNSRLASGVMAFVVFGVAIAAAAIAFTGHAAGTHRSPSFGSGESSPGLIAGPGQYYYWKTVRVMNGPNVVEEMWWGEDGSGRYAVDQSNPDYGTLNGETWQPSEFPGVFPFETDLSGLSTDPATLGSQLLDRSSPDGASPQPQVTMAPSTNLDSSELWRAATQILQMGNSTPALRAALYEVLSGLPEVTAGQSEDPVGRPAVTLTFPFGEYYGGQPQTLYFDPGTHLFMAMDGGQDGTVIVADDGIVDSTQASPPLGQRFFTSVSNSPPEPA
jgi:hypothetical protein